MALGGCRMNRSAPPAGGLAPTRLGPGPQRPEEPPAVHDLVENAQAGILQDGDRAAEETVVFQGGNPGPLLPSADLGGSGLGGCLRLGELARDKP